ncbi:hypothetical protein AMATHDRAFT_135772, partial [Amanita thiersii Skay4041]
ACIIITTRSTAAAFAGLGAITCALSVKVIKKFIRQDRPVQVNHAGRKKVTYGMPSTHSAAMSYYATFIVLASWHLPLHRSLPTGPLMRIVPPVIAVPWATVVIMSRVWLGHHTWPQVIAGASYGVLFGSVWFTLWTNGLNQYGAELERLIEAFILGHL